MKYKSLSYPTEIAAKEGAERFRNAGYTVTQIFWTPYQARPWIVELADKYEL